MADYFPMFCRLKGQSILVIGDNQKARDKVEKLSLFGPDITFIRQKVTDIQALLTGVMPKAVIAADEALVDVRSLYDACIKLRIEINTVDNRACSTFIFPSMICKEHLTVAVSTGGASPAAAAKLRQEIEKALPDRIDEILGWLASLRPVLRVRADIPREALPALYRALADAAFAANCPLDADSTEALLAQFRRH